MNPKTSLLLAASALMSLASAPAASAQTTETLSVLHRFSGLDDNGLNSDGAAPTSVVRAGDGTLYGTTLNAGPDGNGTVFKLSTDGTLTVLHAFSEEDAGTDGLYSNSVILGRDGNLYGTTQAGGANGNGIVYRCTPDGVVTPLYSFTAISDTSPSPANSDGSEAFLSLQGSDGNFYGAASGGGANGKGTIFQVTPGGGLTTLYSFGSADGSQTAGTGKSPDSLIQGRDGNFYGTTHDGGANGSGTFFRLTPAGVLTTLFDFAAATNNDDRPATNGTGYWPGGVVEGGDGNFYGIAIAGGSAGDGTVFRITPAGTFTTLHSFSGADGIYPYSLVQGIDGNFYGVTNEGGQSSGSAYYGNGTFFQVTPAGAFADLYDFGGDLLEPGGLLPGSDGSFYGFSAGTGDDSNGTVFKLTPTPPPAFFTGEADLGNGVYYLAFASGNPFGYYSFLADAHYIYHFDLGYEYVFDAADGKSGVYFYDFTSNGFFYTSPSFPFPYLYDFSLNSVVYYYPDPDRPGRYNTNGVRYFYVFSTGKIISK